MSHAVIFDTLEYANELKAAGVPEKQAEVQARAIKRLMESELVTKGDLESSIKELEYRLTLRMGAMFAATIGILSALKFLWCRGVSTPFLFAQLKLFSSS